MSEGYKAVTPIQVANIVSAYNAGATKFQAVQVFFGCLELIAIREAALRTSGKSRGVRYRPEELERITGLSLQVIKRELRALKRAELLIFSEAGITITETPLLFAREMLDTLTETRKATRLIPIPRSFLHSIAKSHKAALVKTLLAYCIRGLSLKKGEITASGSVKAGWIADTIGLSLRSVRTARRELIALGILSEDNSNQWKLNRCGAYFEINTAWKLCGEFSSTKTTFEPKKPDLSFMGSDPCGYMGKMVKSPTDELRSDGGVMHRKTQSETIPARATGLAVDKSTVEVAKNANKKPTFAPLEVKNSPKFAPPYKDFLTSYRTKNQKLENQISGFCGKGREKSNLKNITREDLTRTSRVLELYTQAVKANWLKSSEQNRLNFVAAAIRAKKVGFEPIKVFVAIVRRGLWHYITQQEEEQARSAITSYQHAQERKQQSTLTEQLSELIKQIA